MTILPGHTGEFEQTLTERVTAPWRLTDGPVTLKLFRWYQASPDGKRIAFSAAGRNFPLGEETDHRVEDDDHQDRTGLERLARGEGDPGGRRRAATRGGP